MKCNKIKLISILGVLVLLGSCHPKQKVRFAFLTDLHVMPGNSNDSALVAAVREINQSDLDFVVMTGDLTNMGSDEELTSFKQITDSITKPLYVLPGNHETNWSETGGLTYKKLFGDDRFDFMVGKYRFIGFNTGPYMKMGDGHVKREDVLWMEKVLSDEKDAVHTLALAHYPIEEGLDNWPEIIEMYKKYQVKLHLCGHGHRLKQMNFNGIPGLMGRALSDSKGRGYTIVEIQNDSIFVSEKLLNQSSQRAFAWNLNEPAFIEEIEPSAYPDYAINKEFSGLKIEWEYQDEASIMGGIGLHPGGMAFWATYDGYLKALDVSSNKVIWTRNIGGPHYSTPLVYKNSVIVATMQGSIEAFDVMSGQRLWQAPICESILGDGLIEDQMLYIGTTKGTMVKMDVETGKVIWTYSGIDGYIQAQPFVTDQEVVFGAWDRHLYCLDKEEGILRWKWNNGHQAKGYSPGNVVPCVANKKVFLVAPDRYFTVLDLKSGKQLYRTNEHRVRESMGMAQNKDMVFAKLMQDSIVAFSTLNPEDGAGWVVDCGYGYEHNPCPMVENDGKVYGGTRDGELFCVSSGDAKFRWRYKIGNSSVTRIDVDENGKVWASLMSGKMVRINDCELFDN